MSDDEKKLKLRRRTFIAMLGATAATVILRDKVQIPDDPPRSPWLAKTRWIGHC